MMNTELSTKPVSNVAVRGPVEVLLNVWVMHSILQLMKRIPHSVIFIESHITFYIFYRILLYK